MNTRSGGTAKRSGEKRRAELGEPAQAGEAFALGPGRGRLVS